MASPVLEAIGIRKVYAGGTVANDGVNLSVAPGVVHAVVGENGAGKSTLMKILFGIERPDEGDLLLDGVPISFSGPKDAIKAGIGMVFQHFSLVPSFSVYENVVLGSEPTSRLKFDRQAAIDSVRTLSERFRLHVDPLSPVGRLPVGQQQRVEILKALYRDARILILDEPTAVLAPQEVDELFVAVRTLVMEGRTIIFIAHKLPEVIEISESITVMRRGRTVGQVMSKDVDEKSLATLMVGHEVSLQINRAPTKRTKVACEVRSLDLLSDRGSKICSDVSLKVRAGEIVGLVGVEGNGQAELLEAVAGLRPAAAGDIFINGSSIAGLNVRERRERGLASIPEDRLVRGLAADATVSENIVATRMTDGRYVRGAILDRKGIERQTAVLIDRYAIRAGGPHARVGTLSGGNMQKVVVARELSEQPEVLLVNQPTRGVDLGATQFIWRSITDSRDAGAAVLLSSADLSELLALSDKLVVFYRGRIVAAFNNSGEIDPATLGFYMLGTMVQPPAEMRAVLQ